MKIALVYDLLYPFSIGGAETRNFSLAKHLAMNGHEVHLFGAKMWRGDDDIKAAKNIYLHGIGRYKSKYSFNGNRRIADPIKYSFLLFFKLKKMDFDLIDVSAFPFFPAISCKLFSILKKTPLIITWHEVWDDYWMEYWNSFRIRGMAGRLVERLAAKLSKNNLCVSKPVADSLLKIGTKESIVISNWIDVKEIDAAKPLSEKYDLITIGRHLRHKNFSLFLRICAILTGKNPRFKALIIGEGPETLNLIRQRKHLGIEKNVDMLGFTADQQHMYRYLKSSKVFVLLSELEGFSIVAFEAMAAGLPVLTIKSKRNALSCFIENEKNGFICEKNELDIAHRIDMILKNGNLLHTLGRNAKKYSGKFDADEKIPEIIAYYNKVINRGKHAA